MKRIILKDHSAIAYRENCFDEHQIFAFLEDASVVEIGEKLRGRYVNR